MWLICWTDNMFRNHYRAAQTISSTSLAGGPHCPTCVRAELNFSCSLQGRVLHSTPPATTTQGAGDAITAGVLQLSCWEHMLSHIPSIPKVPLPLPALSVSPFPGATKGHQHVHHQLSLFGNKYWLKGSLLHRNDLQQATSLQTQNIRNKEAWQSAVANRKILTDGASILSFSLQEHSPPLRFFPHLVVQ